MSKCLSLFALGILCGAELLGATPNRDHLVPDRYLVDRTDSIGMAYRRLIERKLYLTPGEVARFIQLPSKGVETVVSIHREAPTKKYVVTCTQASSLLWETIPQGGPLPAKSSRGIKVIRCDKELPDDVALNIRKAWLKMLLGVKPGEPPPNLPPDSETGEAQRIVYIDGTSEIFIATNAHGKELRGMAPDDYPEHGRVSGLTRLALLLTNYCDPPPQRRDAAAAKLKRATQKFLID